MNVQTGVLALETLRARTVAQTLIDSDVPLPDARAAAEVLSAAARICVDETECLSGQVRVSGTLELTIVCQSDDGEPFGFTAASLFTHRVEMDGVTDGMRAEAQAQVLECVCSAAGAKLRLSAVAELSVAALETPTAPFVTDVSGKAGLETQSASIRASRRRLLAETVFRLREELPCQDASRVLAARGEAAMGDAVWTGEEASVNGTLYVTALVLTSDGRLEACARAIPFTEVVEAPYAANAYADGRVTQLSVTAADAGFDALDAEAAIRIRLYGASTQEHAALLDAYDEKSSFSCTTAELDVTDYLGAWRIEAEMRENVSIPKHLPAANRAVFAQVIPVLTGVGPADGGGTLDAMLLCSFVYQCDGGFLHGFSEDIPVQLSVPAPDPEAEQTRLCVLSAELSGSGRTLVLGVRMLAAGERCQTRRVSFVTEITSGGTPPPQRGILIYCADEGERVWDVGKRFAVPLEKLRAWNADLPDPLPAGRAIVLMK